MKVKAENTVEKEPNYRLTKALIISGIALALLFVILVLIPIPIPDSVFLLIILAGCIDVSVAVALTRKPYNWSLTFLSLITIAFFFRSQRWPAGAALMTFGFCGLSVFSFYSTFVFLKEYSHSKFLKYIGFSSSLVLTVVSMGLLWKNMHWPAAGIILNAGLIIFIPFLFAFVFSLPGSDYIKWSKTDRAVFFRTILIPMVFVYILCMMMFVLPEFWTNLIRHPLLPFNMSDFELLHAPGI
jgi:hypothetical protein